MPVTAVTKVGVTLRFDAEHSIDVFEGTKLTDIVYQTNANQTDTYTGVVRVVNINTTPTTNFQQVCPPEPYAHRYVTVGSIVLDISKEFDADLIRLDVARIVSVGSVEQPEPEPVPEEVVEKIILAPLGDNRTADKIDSKYLTAEALSLGVKVVADGTVGYKVLVSGRNIPEFENGQHTLGHWIGVGFVAPDGVTACMRAGVRGAISDLGELSDYGTLDNLPGDKKGITAYVDAKKPENVQLSYAIQWAGSDDVEYYTIDFSDVTVTDQRPDKV